MKMGDVLQKLEKGGKREKATKTKDYWNRAISHFWTLENEDFEEEKLSQRIAFKIKSLYFGSP